MEKKTLILLIAISLLALAGRLYGISTESYWLDESISVRQSQIPFRDTVNALENDVHTPLYYTLLWGWIRLLGTSENATRLLSTLFGVGAVIALFFFGRKYLNEKAGLIAAAILAVSPLAIYYSQETRPYSLLLLLGILSMHSYLVLIKKINLRNSAFYFLATLALLYTHVFGILLILAQAAHFLITRQKNKGKLLTIQAITCIGILPWIIKSVHTDNIRYLNWISTPTIKSLLSVYTDLAGSVFLLCLFLTLIIIGIYMKRKADSMLLLWLLIPPLAMFLSSMAVIPLFHVRYVLFCAPALALLASKSILDITKKHYIQVGIVILIISISTVAAIGSEKQVDKDDWRTVSQIMKEQRTQGDIIIVHPFYQLDPLTYYYDPSCFTSATLSSCIASRDSIFTLTENTTCCSDSSQLTSVAFNNHLGDYMEHAIWLISVRSELYDAYDSLFTYISTQKNLTIQTNIGDIKIYKFE